MIALLTKAIEIKNKYGNKWYYRFIKIWYSYKLNKIANFYSDNGNKLNDCLIDIINIYDLYISLYGTPEIALRRKNYDLIYKLIKIDSNISITISVFTSSGKIMNTYSIDYNCENVYKGKDDIIDIIIEDFNSGRSIFSISVKNQNVKKYFKPAFDDINNIINRCITDTVRCIVNKIID